MGPDYLDIIVNVLGFVPFGFFFFLHSQRSRPTQAAINILLVLLAGAAISLTIEVVQAWLPNRTSSVMDLLTNTTGALLGAALALTIQLKTAPAKSEPEAR
jgi:glycopeptide antibiotics resistance protein